MCANRSATPIEHICPDGLLFNPNSSKCDIGESVDSCSVKLFRLSNIGIDEEDVLFRISVSLSLFQNNMPILDGDIRSDTDVYSHYKNIRRIRPVPIEESDNDIIWLHHYRNLSSFICKTTVIEYYLMPSSKSCRHYSFCDNDRLHMEMCPKGYAFDENKQNCLPENEADCILCPLKKERQRIADPQNCNHYYVCSMGVRSKWACTNGYRFDKVAGMCKPRADVQCDMDNVCRHHQSMGENFLIADANDCRK